ncbi:SCO1664 family protein [Streptomyces verrucosisporus]|uniref:SCO1664 family protein n=1 Tax=Streptomyces verrucosisporus TaxID=1695161 RepID=UPI0019CF764A|nr:SCO1664 family protein [Streptomyces verrucosisporus]MBN3930132.1 SCO1664 family protein [Streptomyces verrucosisporus]
MPAPERIPPRPVRPEADPGGAPPAELLARGELTVRGRLGGASNTVLYCTVAEADAEDGDGGREVPCVYKPVRGERPLWDFPDGCLARREVAAYEVCEALGWHLVPPTVLRDGPYGEGMCQLWIGPRPDGARERDGREEPGGGGPAAAELLALVEEGEPGPGWKPVVPVGVDGDRTALLVHADDPRLRRLAVLDAVINNADRKGGHLLTGPDGELYGIDHGVTFHTDDKLRTLLWGWAGEPLSKEALQALRGLSAALADGGPLATRLAELITSAELDALRKRTGALIAAGRHPLPGGDWPAIPWPPV